MPTEVDNFDMTKIKKIPFSKIKKVATILDFTDDHK